MADSNGVRLEHPAPDVLKENRLVDVAPLDADDAAIPRQNSSRVLDADIKAFFDTVDHARMMRFIEHRIGDRRVLRLIQKWLTTGVIELGRKTDATASRRYDRR